MMPSAVVRAAIYRKKFLKIKFATGQTKDWWWWWPVLLPIILSTHATITYEWVEKVPQRKRKNDTKRSFSSISSDP